MVRNEFYNKRAQNHYKTEVIYNESRLTADEIIDVIWNFTETYKKNIHAHKAIREAECLAVQYPASMLGVMDNDLFVGRYDTLPVLFCQQVTPLPNTGIGYSLREDWITHLKEENDLSKEQLNKLDKITEYWHTRHIKQLFYNSCTAEENSYRPYYHYTVGPGAGFALFRIAGVFLDYEKLVNLGLNGLIKEIEFYKTAYSNVDPDLYEGYKRAVMVVIDTVRFYINLVEKMEKEETRPSRKKELNEMAAVLRRISTDKPETFREALQLAYLYTAVCGAREYGRMDVYLGDFYAKDLKAGRITEEEAIQLLESLWRIMIARELVTDDRIILGGSDRRNEKNADQFAMIAMEASRRVRDIVPQLTLRCYNGMNPRVYEKALDTIGEGTTFPILYNDDVNIPSVMNAFGVSEEEAEKYVPLGCGEYCIDHSHICSPNAAINLLEILLCTMQNGVENMTGHKLTPDQGNLCDFETFADLWTAYSKNVEFYMRMTAEQVGRLYRITADECAMTLLSPLYDDCLKRGRALLDGGVRGLDATVELYGLVNTSDSLLAIKKLVYDDKRISAKRLLDALNADFKGFEDERRMLLSVPKFGNDLYEPDVMMERVHEQASFAAMAQSGKYGLGRYLMVNINNNVNTLWGRWTPASPDGRLCGKPMSNGNNPSSGMDTNGLTAFLNSILKARADIHGGIVQNMKFSKEMFTDKRDELEAILRTYFQNGGTQAMLTVVGREELEAAREHPENYTNLIVRVGGFTARYVELDDDVQVEILERTLY